MNKLTQWILCLFLLVTSGMNAQVEQEVFASSNQMLNNGKGKLILGIDNLNFFQNNEYKSIADGYSLPGLWIQPKLIFYPLSNLKIEAGAHILYYSGATHYPAGVYTNLPEQTESNHKNIHTRPFFRANLSSPNGIFHLVFGNLYGGSSHQLIEALYNPEQNLCADPESGLQILCQSAPIDADIWLNWQNFIFRNDNHKEQFILGLSSRIKFNSLTDNFHWYIPVQIVAQHLGGEIQAGDFHGISSLANAAVGFEAQWNIRHKILKKIIFESHFIVHKQLTGNLLPTDEGYGWHNALGMRLSNIHLKTGHMFSADFIPIIGNPFFGSLANMAEPDRFGHSHMIYGRIEYSKRLKQIGSLGINLTLYQYMPGTARHSSGVIFEANPSTSIQAGIYLRITPSLLLHKF